MISKAYAKFSGESEQCGITALRLHTALEKMGEKLGHVAIDEMIHFGDTDNSGSLTLNEFKRIMSGENANAIAAIAAAAEDNVEHI